MLKNRLASLGRRLDRLEARLIPPPSGPALSMGALAASMASCQDEELKAAMQKVPEDPPDLAAEVEALERRRQQLKAELKEISA